MHRHQKTSLALGGAAAFVSLALHFSGLLEPVGERLENFYSSRGFFPAMEAGRVAWLEVAIILAGGLGVAWSLAETTRGWQRSVIAGGAILVAVAFSPVLALYGRVFDPVLPLASVVLATVASMLLSRSETGRRKERIERVLEDRISPSALAALLESDDVADFGAASRQCSVLVCRILNFGGGERPFTPADQVYVGNLFLRTIPDFLSSRGAHLDEAGPSRIRVSFGLYRVESGHADRACTVAIELGNRLSGLAREIEARWFRKVEFGIGIETGEAVVGICRRGEGAFLGTLGSLGDFAERLSQANAIYGSRILVSPATLALVPDRFEARPMEMLYDPGSGSLAEIYEILRPSAAASDLEKERRELFWKGVIHFRAKRYEAALETLSRARVPGEDDGPLSYYVARIQEVLTSPEGGERKARNWTEDGHARLLSRI